MFLNYQYLLRIFKYFLRSISLKTMYSFVKDAYRWLHFEKNLEPVTFANSITTILLYEYGSTTNIFIKEKDINIFVKGRKLGGMRADGQPSEPWVKGREKQISIKILFSYANSYNKKFYILQNDSTIKTNDAYTQIKYKIVINN